MAAVNAGTARWIRGRQSSQSLWRRIWEGRICSSEGGTVIVEVLENGVCGFEIVADPCGGKTR